MENEKEGRNVQAKNIYLNCYDRYKKTLDKVEKRENKKDVVLDLDDIHLVVRLSFN